MSNRNSSFEVKRSKVDVTWGRNVKIVLVHIFGKNVCSQYEDRADHDPDSMLRILLYSTAAKMHVF